VVSRREPERVGIGLAARFALTTAGVLLVVGGLGAFVLLSFTSSLAARHNRANLLAVLQATADVRANGVAERSGLIARSDDGSSRVDVVLRDGRAASLHSFTVGTTTVELVVPARGSVFETELRGAILAVVALMVIGASVAAWWLANQVAEPLRRIVDDVRNLSHGDLRHRAKVRGGGEVAQLGRALERMSEELADAADAQLELGLRERELEVAEQVREALLPLATPLVPGYDLGGMHLSGEELSGVFHDFIEYADGSVGLLVCEVSGDGVPAALIGAIARTYLRSALSSQGDVAAAFARANRDLSRDLRRGLVVTALFARLDPASGRATVACAGHRLPLVRTSAADGRLRVFQPEGVALGLDRGPVFERTLAVQDLEVAPGDRLVLASSGAVAMPDMDGNELSEKGFFTLVHRAADQPTGTFLRSLRREFEARAGDEPRVQAVSIVTVLRERHG
jgi:serine phosphatase RsbU (regulator of sigma subunit)